MSATTETLRRGVLPPVAETVVVSPIFSLQERVLPTYPTLRFYPNGLIDLEPDMDNFSESQVLGSEYQDIAMKAVDGDLAEGSVALGAHLLDAAILGTDIAKIGRPDVMVFKHGPVLDKMFEFKRSWHSELEEKQLKKKLERISSLLEILRANPMLLGELINRVARQEILCPISIPPDDKLEPVVFISSSPWNRTEVLSADTTALKGSFRMVPLPNIAA